MNTFKITQNTTADEFYNFFWSDKSSYLTDDERSELEQEFMTMDMEREIEALKKKIALKNKS